MTLTLGLDVLVPLALLSLAASFVNGGLGYGYSSLSTPLALLVLVNKVINPVYVLTEASMNTVMLGFSGRAGIRATFRRVLPIVAALVPGIIVGSLALSKLSPTWVKLVVYGTILPLILLQAAGVRRAIKSETTAGVPLGLGIGLLYSITTISGPPIALFWNNQGLPQREFKAAVAQVRIAESYLTCASYYLLGLFTASTVQIFTWVAPPVVLGIPLGIFVVRRVNIETFRRICMSFDSLVVGYGLATVLGILFGLLLFGYYILLAVIAINAVLLYRFFSGRGRSRSPGGPPPKDIAGEAGVRGA
ncbi:MAG TPA: sulfite exporter TauE/SafE family protein [Nitrososphaerales archaeon]|nr:sulfite exporter TauE/SafE family protein [Nitrososphaerales archaeon]